MHLAIIVYFSLCAKLYMHAATWGCFQVLLCHTTNSCKVGLCSMLIWRISCWTLSVSLRIIIIMVKLDNSQLASLPSSVCPKLRGISSFMTWATYFANYTATLSSSHRHLVQSQLAYMYLTICEARKNGRDGWKAYDSTFRQNAPEDTTTDWSHLESYLYATTFIAEQASDLGHFCRMCCDSAHDLKDCTLHLVTNTCY